MRNLMGNFARDVARRTSYAANDYIEYANSGRDYDEFREGYGGDVEYRYADFPLALGEAIMMT